MAFVDEIRALPGGTVTLHNAETGIRQHPAALLTDEERAENATMMVCVSRSRTPRLVLDL